MMIFKNKYAVAKVYALKVGRLLTCLRLSRTFKKSTKSGDFVELGQLGSFCL
jgi:hypothetical protein